MMEGPHKHTKRRAWTEKSHLLTAERKLFRSLRGQSSNDDLGKIGSANDNTYNSLTPPEGEQPGGRTLGTFNGVFAPVSLSMLSSILFLRVGYIVGNAGILETMLLLAIAYIILVSTVLSICAIATNGAVEGGGVYYMISRTLGAEFGGSVGTLFYFANVVSSALYLAACTEGIVSNFGPQGTMAQVLPGGFWWNFAYASLCNALNLCVCLVGAKWFGRTSALILAMVVVCTLVTVASFFPDTDLVVTYTDPCRSPTNNSILPNCTVSVNGTFTGFLASDLTTVESLFQANLLPRYARDCSDATTEVSFFTVFGVLFSGVTGIMAGANMSGELVAPGKNIPRGTLSACLFTLTILLLLSILTGLTCDPAMLLHNCMYMSSISIWPPAVAVGVLLATFSASLNNLIGASRVLEAVAKDVLFGPFLGFISKGNVKDNPVAAVFVTWLLVQLFLLMGSLNRIAQLSSVLFLLSYASVNLACLGLDLASAPNFRPSFKYFSWHTCLVGLVGTSIMMFFISPMFSAVSILLCLSLVLALNFFSPVRNANWGSISQALLFHQVRKYLLLLDPRKDHVKFWRPQMLLLVHNPRTSCSLIDFVNTLKKGGLYVLGHVHVGKLEEMDHDPVAVSYPSWLGLVDHLKIKAFVELTVATCLREGIQQLVRISGIGAMKPNTILLGFRDKTFHGDDFASPFSPYSTMKFEGVFAPTRQPLRKASAPFYDPSSVMQSSSGTEDDESKLNKRVSKEDYVGVILDVLKMRKNVCICRHFQNLDKGSLFSPDRASIFGTRARGRLYLDVWLVDFFSPSQTDVTDTTSLFILQLACIVNMVPRWKKLTIRVFAAARDCASQTNSESEHVPSGDQQPHHHRHIETEEQLRHMLELLRIRATTHVLNWMPQEEEQASNGQERLTHAYLRSACETVRRRSGETAVTFLYLPMPPAQESQHAKYLDCLSALTDQWPPTLLVRGVSPVTSTTL